MAQNLYSDVYLGGNKIGRDADNLLDFTTDNEITFRVGASNGITIAQDTVTFTSANADDPVIIIENTTADSQAARLQFKKHRGVDAVDGDNIGEIEFWGYDDGTPSVQNYGKIICEIDDATSGQESGSLGMYVATHDGGNNLGFKIIGGSVDNEVDATIGNGAASVTTVTGTLTMGTTAAMDNAGLLTVGAQTGITAAANLVTVGTIGTGVWNGTAINNDYLDADTAHLTSAQTFTGVKTFGTTTKLQFRDANAYINSPTANDIEVAATTITLDAASDIQLEQDTTVTGNLTVSGSVTHDFNATTFENQLADDVGSGKIIKYSPGADDTLVGSQIYFLHTDGTWDLVDADAVATGGTQMLGVGLQGSARTVGVFIEGFIRIASTEILNTPGSGAVDGLPLYVSTEVGHFDFTAPSGTGDFVRIVGYAIDDDSGSVLVNFSPSKDHIILA